MPDPDSSALWRRSFIALAPDGATRDALLRIPLQPALRPILRADLHLTMAFLGDLPDAQREALEARLPQAPGKLAPLAFTGVEAWPTAARPNVVVATFETSPQLTDLLGQINHILHRLGFAVEGRRFRPHITLARGGRKKSAAGPAPAGDVATPLQAGFTGLGLYARTPPERAVRYQSLWLRSL